MANVKKDESKSGKSSIILEGCYVKTENLWTSTISASTLLVVERQSSTLSKPPQYILHVDQEGQRTYISSLFPTKIPDIYRMDFKGTRYDLTKSSHNSLCISIGIIPTK